jgi:flagellin FlaB
MLFNRLRRNKRGIVGIEAAIVLVAFIVIAAALSYVVINMGFHTTQKTKETMQTGLDESLTALQLDGVVTAKTNATSSHILNMLVPVKLSAGKAAIDLGESAVVVSVYLENQTLMNIYDGSICTTNTTWNELNTTLDLSDNEAKFAIYNSNNNTVLESNEKAFLMIRLQSNSTAGMISDYDAVKIEVRTAKGAALTIIRTAPGGLQENEFVDLG